MKKKAYKIYTFEDILEIPLEKWDEFFVEFRVALEVGKKLYEHMKKFGVKNKKIIKYPMIYNDDDKKEITINIVKKNRANSSIA